MGSFHQVEKGKAFRAEAIAGAKLWQFGEVGGTCGCGEGCLPRGARAGKGGRSHSERAWIRIRRWV